jgi:hypothetical protein
VCSDTRHYAAEYFARAHARSESEQSNHTDLVCSRSDLDAAESRGNSAGSGSHHSLYPRRREQWRPATELVGLCSITSDWCVDSGESTHLFFFGFY